MPECGRWHLTSHGAPYPVIPGPQSKPCAAVSGAASARSHNYDDGAHLPLDTTQPSHPDAKADIITTSKPTARLAKSSLPSHLPPCGAAAHAHADALPTLDRATHTGAASFTQTRAAMRDVLQTVDARAPNLQDLMVCVSGVRVRYPRHAGDKILQMSVVDDMGENNTWAPGAPVRQRPTPPSRVPPTPTCRGQPACA